MQKEVETDGTVFTDDELDPDFKYQVLEEPGGEDFLKCFQCGTCAASCPAREVDRTFNCRRIIRWVKLGAKDHVLTSSFVWMCSACYSCLERCPQNVKITDLMTALKNLAVKEGYAHPNLKGHIDLLEEFGALAEVSGFENMMREKFDVGEIRQSPKNVAKVLEASGMRETIDTDREEEA